MTLIFAALVLAAVGYALVVRNSEPFYVFAVLILIMAAAFLVEGTVDVIRVLTRG